jgi:hypothetical protein
MADTLELDLDNAESYNPLRDGEGPEIRLFLIYHLLFRLTSLVKFLRYRRDQNFSERK